MKKLLLILIGVALLLIGGCSKAQEADVPLNQQDEEVTDVEDLGQELDTLEEEDLVLDTSDLEGLENDLDVEF